tara:strand:+ start:11533 stop:12900 length:1368 start_codon:yes stop_codon:yes gene_type:complete
MKMIIFGIIAKRDVDFFLNIAQSIQRNSDEEVSFISFYEPGNKKINKAGFKVYNLYDYVKNKSNDIDFSDYLISDIKDFILHEMVTFNTSEKKVISKYKRYLPAINYIIEDIISHSNGKKVVILQELGGFVAPLSLYFCAMKNKIDHYFFEPSFFKGRLLFVKNDYLSLQLPNNFTLNKGIKDKLNALSQNKTTLIPEKDIHHFKYNIFRKIATLKNLKIIFTKIFNKYIFSKKEEYNHIFNHIIRNLNYMFNSYAVKKFYSKEIASENFNIYFPLHVPLDYALTIRAPKYFDQLKLIENILALTTKNNFTLFIKEHPASIGGFSSKRIKKIIQKYPNNFVLLDPKINTYDIIKKVNLILTINSKTGAEALSLYKKVISLGDSFYMHSSEVIYCEHFEELDKKIYELKNDVSKTVNEENIISFFSKIYRHSYPLELYSNEENNLTQFANIILKEI